ncbi:MAG: hypothetical protein P1U58_12260 [Verrucomicrobiales bacterium]|nr:hypothetical protein [Verrucomicrobiales bacterium]
MLRILLLLISLFPATPAILAEVDEGRSTEMKDDREKWDSLSEEDREKLRKALREVWTDPAVLSAREEVKLASEGYQEAIREAVGKSDPTLTGLLKKIQHLNEGSGNSRVKGGTPGRFGPPKGLESPAGPPAFLEKLTDEERARFKAAEEKVQNADSVLAARKEMEKLRSQDDQMRRRRMEAHLKMRRAVLEAMFAEDPELKDLQSRLGFTPGGKSKGRPGGKKQFEGRSDAKE